MPDSFPHFRTLPLELRLKIWTWTLPRPRILQYNNLSSHEPDSPLSHTNPIALSVNKESRYLAQRYFSPPLDSRRFFFDFQHDYFFLSSLPEQGVPRSKWEDKFASDDMEKISNVIFSYRTFEDCHAEFKGSLEWYVGNVMPGLKEVVLEFHVSERKLRGVVMKGWMRGSWEWELDAGKLGSVLEPMKRFAEGVVMQVLKEREEISRVIEVEVKGCGVCSLCGRLARCHMAQKAFRAKARRMRELEERKSQGSGESTSMDTASSEHVHQAEVSPFHAERGAGND